MARIAQCRSCGSTDLQVFLSLGDLPLSDAMPRPDPPDRPEARYPLDVAFCPDCTLVQILETVPPEELFCRDYPYFSSFSDSLLAHSRANVAARIAERKLDERSLVVEVASNDGYLLQYYRDAGVPVLGIDPAEGPVAAARERGVPTLCEFFGPPLAERLRAEGRVADVLHANNVLAHVADTNGFVAALATLLDPEGVAVIEVPYVRDLIDHCEFDTIYHEHLCYFSVTALDALFRRHGLFLNHLERLAIHGGSLRLFVERRDRPGDRVREVLAEEREEGLTRLAYYEGFSERVDAVRRELRELCTDLRRRGRRLAGYGAAAKGTILLNTAGLDAEVLEFVADRNVHKQGRLMPGVRVPICAPERILEDRPDYLLILPWNLVDEIVAQQAEYRARGGRFIVPIPRPRVL